MWMINVAPRPLLAQEKRACTHDIGGGVSRKAGSDGCGKSRPPSGFDPWTVKPVASRCADYAVSALCVM